MLVPPQSFLRLLVDSRLLLSLLAAAATGAIGLHAYPVSFSDPFIALIGLHRPDLLRALSYGYAVLWFSTPFFVTSLFVSFGAVLIYRIEPSVRFRPLPQYPPPEERPLPFLVLGESHVPTMPDRAAEPKWLTIPQRGLYTGVMVVGAVGTGKTSACMYPYVDQLMRWQSQDEQRKIGGLVMEVKGDFCRQVRTILDRTSRSSDYIEIGLDTGTSYNPLHNDLDPYAVAYAIASLLNNLFGRSKEPFWQQAYTDLLKFVILLRRLTDGYTTLSDVYRYILDDSQIDRDIRRLKSALADPPDCVSICKEDYHLLDTSHAWAHWFEDDGGAMAHPYDAELETFLAAKGVPYTVARPKGRGWAARRHQLDALERW